MHQRYSKILGSSARLVDYIPATQSYGAPLCFVAGDTCSIVATVDSEDWGRASWHCWSYRSDERNLTQISVNPSYKDHAAAASFCHCCLYTLRGVLLEWNTSTDALQILPLAKMPKIGQNSVWTVVHPNRVMFLTEIQSSLRFLSLHSQAFEGEPWLWLVDFLETLEYHLAV